MKLHRSLFSILALLYSFSIAAARVDTLEVFSPSMNKFSRCLVLVPESYTSNATHLPVLYLLHGYSGNYTSWMGTAPQLLEVVETYQLMVVCPDGGYDSWYLDSPVDSTVRYATYITQELVPIIDQQYRTISTPSGRGIAGLSMGGHGAITLAARHPEVFGAAGSMSGGLDLRPFKKNNWDLEGVLGKPVDYWDNWETASAINWVPQLKASGVELMLDCGVEDFFLDVNRSMHQALLEREVEHDYIERPGGHDHLYWQNAIDFQVLFFNKFFSKGK
jgi:S-formylglutathione hydrolase FrmB